MLRYLFLYYKISFSPILKSKKESLFEIGNAHIFTFFMFVNRTSKDYKIRWFLLNVYQLHIYKTVFSRVC